MQIYLPFEAESHYADKTGKQNCVVYFPEKRLGLFVVLMQKRIPICSPITGVKGGDSPEGPQTDQFMDDEDDHADTGKDEMTKPSGAIGC